jgi:hypothetical protein
MANPNIVAVTSIKGESIGEALTTTLTTAIVKAGFTSDGIGSGEDNAATIYLASTVRCPADDILVVVDKPIYLMEGDVLEGGASAATADIFISYEVIDDA